MSPASNAQKRATNKYRATKAQLTVTVSKETKAALEQAAQKSGTTVTQLIRNLITAYLKDSV